MTSTLFLGLLLAKTTLLLALALAAGFLMTRASAGTRHLVGLVGLLGALVLPALAAVLPHVRLPLLPGPRAAAAEPIPSAEAPADAPAAPGPAAWSDSKSPSGDAPFVWTPARPEPKPRVGHLGVDVPALPELPDGRMLLALSWALGALAVLARFAAGTRHVAGILARATRVSDAETLALVAELSAARGLDRAPRLFVSPEVSVALAAGVLRPVVLLPEESCRWTPERLRLVLLHEFAHVSRRDCLTLVLTAAATSVYWFHPLVWALSARMRRDGELACDDAVLAAGARASDYAGELLAIFHSLRLRGAETPVALALTEGSEIEGRLRAILAPAAPRGAPSRRAARGGFLAAACATALLASLEPWSAGGSRAQAAAFPMPLEVTDAAVAAHAPEPPPVRGVAFASGRSVKSGHEWYSRGMDLHHAGRYERAIEAFRHAIEAGYREDASSYNIACGYALSADKDQAFAWLAKARDAGFDLEEYVDRDDDLDPLRGDPRFADFERSLGSGYRDRKTRRREHLAERFDRLSSASPKSGESYERLGRELLDARDFDRAAKAFAEAARLGYREGTSLYNQACALSRKGDRAAALAALERSLAAGFDSPHHFDDDDDLDNLRGERRFDELDDVAHDLTLSAGLEGGGFLHRLLANRGSWREAAQRYRRYLSDKTFGGRAAFDLGFAELKLDDPAAARDAFLKAQELGYRRPTTMYDLACAYARLGEKDAAFDALFKSLDAGFDGRSQLRHDEDLRALRRDPRFEKAVRVAERNGGDD